MANIKYTNSFDRGAGSGVILAGAKPMKRGIWDMYETTNPQIGNFEVCFWIELNQQVEYINDKIRNAALDELATFFENNILDNLIVLDYSIRTMMGGVSINAGSSYFNDKKRKAQGIFDKFGREFISKGYELRFSRRDATTFTTLWRGYELPSSDV